MIYSLLLTMLLLEESTCIDTTSQQLQKNSWVARGRNKKLCYCKQTAWHAVSVKILSTVETTNPQQIQVMKLEG